MEKQRLAGKVCVITGGGRGIGRAACELFGRHGAVLYILEFDPASGRETEAAVRAAGGEAEFIRCDVSDHRSVEQAFARIAEKHGRLDVLYNNAGVYLNGPDGPIADITPENWARILGINLNGVYHCCHYGIPLMKKHGGAIINTASSAGVIGIPRCDAYTATKGAIVALTRSLAVEYAKFGIRTNCMAPAGIATEMVKQSNPDGPEFDSVNFFKVRTPSRRFGEPLEVAQLALFLASDESTYVNGTIIPVDGGITVCGDLAKPDADAAELAAAGR